MAPPALQPQLQTKLDEYRSARAFNPATWIEAKCAKLNAYMSNAGLKTCVTSVSGGIDSAVVLALTAHAKKMASSPIVNVIGVCQPIHSSAWALERGRENVESCGATLVVIDQTDLHTQLQVFLGTVTD
jgi:NAD+ synthase (glutamine-hydrolysing)